MLSVLKDRDVNTGDVALDGFSTRWKYIRHRNLGDAKIAGLHAITLECAYGTGLEDDHRGLPVGKVSRCLGAGAVLGILRPCDLVF